MRLIWMLPLFAAAAISSVARADSPYSGQQTRDIKSLSQEETADLQAGRGMGMAKAAELNHYPGPAHVLELKAALGLSANQLRAIENSFQRMSATAKMLGAALIEHEHALDGMFADGSITADALREETAAI